ncbi:MAG: aldehyde ferredoxin oxidoreductase [Candidatus Eisenbacteria bacterium]|nr:aldehyde ferredoxin oxidoreductase [Candidatus Eisenbacteria bacterium]
MEPHLKVLMIDAGSGFYRIVRHPLGSFFGPVDLGLHLAGRHNSLNIGAGILAGSILPGSNRLVFTGFSPAWGGFFISSMGGAALVFDNLGVDMVSIVGRASSPSLLYLNRVHGEEIEVAIEPLDLPRIWRSGREGVYAVMDAALESHGARYANEPRVLAVGPAAATTDIGAIASAPVADGAATPVDTWAGRGGLGSKLLREHGLAGVIYGGTFVDEDFRDRRVADQWFQERYAKRLAAKDFEATVKYRFDPQFATGGTFGVNYSTVGGRLLAFNYRSIYWSEEQRVDTHRRFILDHYLRQFNEETIASKSQKTCGEPCSAVCKKMRAEFKKDYEPYQALGPLCGVFDQRAAERLTHHADRLGFDAISVGGVVAWVLENLSEGRLQPDEVGVRERPHFAPQDFSVASDSEHNAALGVGVLDAIIAPGGLLNLSEGARKLARRLARARGPELLDTLVYSAFARKGWMVPNQYWNPGVLSPMPIVGKYYMYYGQDFVAPRELGRRNAARFQAELILDNLGTCRFHRGWAEEMLPEVVDRLWERKEAFLQSIRMTASRIASRNASIYWEPQRNRDLVRTFLERQREVEEVRDEKLDAWIERFRGDADEASLDFWFETLKGTHESLREF